MTRIASIFLFLLVPLTLPVHAETGSRLNKQSPSDMATYHYERGQKAEKKAEKFLADQKDAKAHKQYLKAAKLYERALRINAYHRGARAALGNALLNSGPPAEAVERLAEAAEDYPEIEALQEHLAQARSALKAANTRS